VSVLRISLLQQPLIWQDAAAVRLNEFAARQRGGRP